MHETLVEERLRQFVNDYCDGRNSLLVLLFLGRHPYARFSQMAIANALDARKSDLDRALQHLVSKRLVTTWTAEYGLTFYSLTEEEPLYGLVMEIIALDWWQQQVMLEQV